MRGAAVWTAFAPDAGTQWRPQSMRYIVLV